MRRRCEAGLSVPSCTTTTVVSVSSSFRTAATILDWRVPESFHQLGGREPGGVQVCPGVHLVDGPGYLERRAAREDGLHALHRGAVPEDHVPQDPLDVGPRPVVDTREVGEAFGDRPLDFLDQPFDVSALCHGDVSRIRRAPGGPLDPCPLSVET